MGEVVAHELFQIDMANMNLCVGGVDRGVLCPELTANLRETEVPWILFHDTVRGKLLFGIVVSF